jgi:hypothetical protein
LNGDDAKKYLHLAADEHRKAIMLIPEDIIGRASVLNNLGIALLKLARVNEEPILNFRAAIDKFTEALRVPEVSKAKRPELYGLIKGDLGDALVDLSFHENQPENLQRGVRELEEGLASVSPKNYPLVFAENAYKAGVANLNLYNVAPKDDGLLGLTEIACSILVFDRVKSKQAHVAARTLKVLTESIPAQKLRKILASKPPPSGCDYKVDEILALMDKLS